MEPEEPHRQKIFFAVKNPGIRAESETMWAQHVEGDIYKLDNVPLLAFGVALNDVLVATHRPSTVGPSFAKSWNIPGIRRTES